MLVYFVVNCVETLALGVAASVTASVALRAQTAANAADMAVQVFLLIGVLSSARAPDEAHPLGYGRERFFWSYLAALGVFVGGAGLALDGAIRSAIHPSAVGNYTIAYLVLARPSRWTASPWRSRSGHCERWRPAAGSRFGIT